MSSQMSKRRARGLRAVANGAVVESLESRQLFAAVVPQLSIEATDPIASEVGPNTGTYRITRTGDDLATPLRVGLIVGGRATNGVDYGVIGNAITIPAGQATFSFLLRPFGDTKIEPTESITVTLASSAAYTIDPHAGLANVLLKDGTGATLAEIGGYFRANVNFQPYDAPVPAGYIVDGGATYKKHPNGKTYGWSSSKIDTARDRNTPRAYDQRYDTLVHMGLRDAWNMAVPNGTYIVHLVAGDPSNFDSVYNIKVEGIEIISAQPSATNLFAEGTATVVVTDGTITLTNGSSAHNNKLMFINIAQLSDAAGHELGLPLVSFADFRADAAEPNNHGIWRVRRTGATTRDLVVTYTIGGNATNNLDYEKLTGTLTIPAGESEAELRITVRNDGAVESAEVVTVSLIDGPGYVAAGDTDALCTITSDEAPALAAARMPALVRLGALGFTSQVNRPLAALCDDVLAVDENLPGAHYG